MKIRRKQIIFFVLLFFLAFIIFDFSAQNGEKSAGFSENLTEKILRLSGMTDVNFENAERILRKTAHFVEFFAFGLLLCLLVLSFGCAERKAAVFAFLISFLYAFADEFHQFFVPERAPSFLDVLIDSVGAACGILLVFLFRFLSKKKKC